MNEIIDDLRRVEAFKELAVEDLGSLAEACQPKSYEPRRILGREGELADRLFVLMSGTVGIWVDHGTEEADLLAIREGACLVGEMSVADELPRSATIVARTPVEVYELEADVFRKLLSERGHIALALMKAISRLVRLSNDSFVSELRERNTELEITNKELREAQLQLVRQERLSSLGKFSSMILHDLRNPMSVIKGYADLMDLKLEEQNSPLLKYARQIRREMNRLSSLTGELLDYTRGEIRLAYAPLRMDTLIRQLRENVESRLSAKNLIVEWDVEYADGALLDGERMLRVLINLTDNARKAADRGGRIVVAVKKEGGNLLFIVEDNGVGMDKDTVAHIFEPFYSTSERGGTGLGMHIVKTVVEAHDGSVKVLSKPGKGTRITLTLPMRL